MTHNGLINSQNNPYKCVSNGYKFPQFVSVHLFLIKQTHSNIFFNDLASKYVFKVMNNNNILGVVFNVFIINNKGSRFCC